MNKRQELEIEIKSYQEVIFQFSKGCDARMSIQLDRFLKDIEKKIEELKIKLNGT